MRKLADLQKRAPAQLPFMLEAMEEAHLDVVLSIEKAVFSHPWRRQDFQYALEKEGSDCAVALVEGQVIGYALGFQVLNEFHLADFAIHPDLQNRGLGWQLLNRLLDRLDDRVIHVVTLEVRVSNVPAIALYRKAGFQTAAIRKDYYSRPREDALVMLRALRGDLSDWVGHSFTGS